MKKITGKVPGVPKKTYVSRVVASRFAEGTVFVTFDGIAETITTRMCL